MRNTQATIISDEERNAIYQDYLGGMNTRQISEKYGYTISAIHWQIRKARSKLGVLAPQPVYDYITREELERYAHSLSVGQVVGYKEIIQKEGERRPYHVRKKAKILALYPYFARTDHGDILYQDLFMENAR